MTRWRKHIGEKGCELILAAKLQTGLRSGAVNESSLKRINVDTTVQPKAVRYLRIPARTIGAANVW
jgi:IS5 family transposase